VFAVGLPAGATDRLGVARLGGHREHGETAWQCAAREVREEASLAVRPLTPPATYWVGPPHDPAALAAGPWAPVSRGPQRRADVSQDWNEELDPVWKGERPVRDAAQAFKTRMEALLTEFRAQGIL
jgi:8-oxo-dGTP pyrophosphatase MutT (NUDIX family)